MAVLWSVAQEQVGVVVPGRFWRCQGGSGGVTVPMSGLDVPVWVGYGDATVPPWSVMPVLRGTGRFW